MSEAGIFQYPYSPPSVVLEMVPFQNNRLATTKEPLPVSSHATSFTLLRLSLYNMQSASLPAVDSARAGRSLDT